MKHAGKTLLLALVVATGMTGVHAESVQRETDHSCCLAAEWQAVVAPSPPQSSEVFCCLANEWRAPETAPGLSVQSDELSCCLASEWQVL